MGEHTPTNWSTLVDMAKRALQSNEFIYLTGSKFAPDDKRHGIEVFMIPVGTDPNYLDLTEDSEDWKKYHAAWLWAIVIEEI